LGADAAVVNGAAGGVVLELVEPPGSLSASAATANAMAMKESRAAPPMPKLIQARQL
jgi:hypothetical protein